MIYLIGGAPRVGKSTIAKQFAEYIGGQFISTDELENSNQDPSVIFYSDAKKNILTPHERIEVVANEAKQISPNIYDIINKAVKDQQNIVIEGVHLFPSYVAHFVKEFGEENIKAIFIGSTDIEIIMQGMVQDTSPNNWLKDFNQDVLRQIALFTKTFSDYLYNESKKYNLLYRERSNDFKKDTFSVIKELSS